MATNSISKSDVACTESPASWNTRYVTPEGFTCQITIRGENGKDLLEKAGVAMSYLIEHGYQPDHKPLHYNKGGGGKQCPIHQCQMKQYEKNGQVWFSHKTDDGKWCRGKSPKGA
jgi:hypothetical protein